MRQCLRKSYFLFISSVVTNNLSAVIAHQGTYKIHVSWKPRYVPCHKTVPGTPQTM